MVLVLAVKIDKLTAAHLAGQIAPAFHDPALRLVSLLGLSQKAINSIPDTIDRQIGENSEKDRIGPVNAATDAFPVLDPAIVFSPITGGAEFMIDYGMRSIADFETRFTYSHRILSVLAKARRPRSKAGIEPTHFGKDFLFKRHIGPGQASAFTDFLAIVNDWDVVFTQFIGIGRPSIETYPRQNTSLHGIERRKPVGVQMLDQPLRVHDHIVIDNEKILPCAELRPRFRALDFPCRPSRRTFSENLVHAPVAWARTLAVLSVEPLSTIRISAVIESSDRRASKLANKRCRLAARLKVGTITLTSKVSILEPPKSDGHRGTGFPQAPSAPTLAPLCKSVSKTSLAAGCGQKSGPAVFPAIAETHLAKEHGLLIGLPGFGQVTAALIV